MTDFDKLFRRAAAAGPLPLPHYEGETKRWVAHFPNTLWNALESRAAAYGMALDRLAGICVAIGLEHLDADDFAIEHVDDHTLWAGDGTRWWVAFDLDDDYEAVDVFRAVLAAVGLEHIGDYDVHGDLT